MGSHKYILVACSLLSFCSAKSPRLDVGKVTLFNGNEPQKGTSHLIPRDGTPFLENVAIGNNYDLLKVVPPASSYIIPTTSGPKHAKTVQNLEKEMSDVHAEVGREIQQLRRAHQLVTRAQQIADQARNQAQTIGVQVNEARIAVDHTQRTAQQAQADVASRSSMVQSARARLQQLAAQLERAQNDLQNAKKASRNNSKH